METMKRAALFVAGLALTGGLAVGCSKAADVATPNIDANKIENDAAKCTDMMTKYTATLTPLASGGGSDADKQAIDQAIDNMKASVPSNIQADLTTIKTGIDGAKTPAAIGTFLTSADYTKANTEITTYLTTTCTKVGS
jgi:hypothetical protein